MRLRFEIKVQLTSQCFLCGKQFELETQPARSVALMDRFRAAQILFGGHRAGFKQPV